MIEAHVPSKFRDLQSLVAIKERQIPPTIFSSPIDIVPPFQKADLEIDVAHGLVAL
jgi:hypothetical protein